MPSKSEASRRALRKALKTFQSIRPNGGQLLLSRKIGVTQPAIWAWLHTAKKGVPEKYWPLIEKACKGKVKFPKRTHHVS